MNKYAVKRNSYNTYRNVISRKKEMILDYPIPEKDTPFRPTEKHAKDRCV